MTDPHPHRHSEAGASPVDESAALRPVESGNGELNEAEQEQSGEPTSHAPHLVLVPLTVVPNGIEDHPEFLDEEALLRYEQFAADAMKTAYASITDTALELSQKAEEARVAKAVADTEGADAIASCVAQAAAAFKMRHEVSALRVAWVASQTAEEVAAQVPNGDEAAAAVTASRVADVVALAVQKRAAEYRLGAYRSSLAAIAAAVKVAEAADIAATATELAASHQALALGAIAFDTSIQVAIDDVGQLDKRSAPAPVSDIVDPD